MGINGKKQKRGVIAISTLLISTVLLVLIVALLWSLQVESRLVLNYNRSTQALYVGEAGLADAVAQLSADNTWQPNPGGPILPLEVTFDDGSKYSIVFDTNDGIPPTKYESVNNLDGNGTKDGPRGLGTVPPHTADVVVKVESRGSVSRYEALISRGFADPIHVPMLAAGEIKMEGAVKIRGIESLANPVSIPAGIHSNKSGNIPNVITWEGGGEDAFISGDVTTSSTSAGAVSAVGGGGDFEVNAVQTGRPLHSYPQINLQAQVDKGMMTSHDLTPQIVTGGTTSLTNRSYRYTGGTINGDLELDNVNLYVDGDLTINGSITGSGTIYVTGNTSFQGSADFTNDDNQALALFSQGNVTLEGFNGTEFLDGVASTNADFDSWNQAAKEAHAELLDIIADPENYIGGANPTAWGGMAGTPVNLIDQLRGVLGDDSAPPTDDLKPQDTLGKMAQYLQDNFAGDDSAEFLVRRLENTRKLYEANPGGDTPDNIIRDYRRGRRDATGVLDILNDGDYSGGGNHRAVLRAANQAQVHNFNKLGSSYFQGMIYTNGAVYAANEIEILGTLLTHKTSDSPTGTWSVGGKTLQAGDIYLANGTNLIYNKQLMENPFVGSSTGPVTIRCWIGE